MAASSDTALRQARLKYSRKRLAVALLVFAAPFAAYIGNFVLIAALGWPWGAGLAVIQAWLTGALFIIGHDACHQSYTGSRALNGLIGRLCFLPSLHNFSLWDVGHNRTHHRHNNVRGFDYVWEPMSPEDYARATGPRRLLYRFARSPFGVPFYYLAAIWFPKMFLLRRRVYAGHKGPFLRDAILVWGFLALEVAAAVALGLFFGRNAIAVVGLAVVMPFAIWGFLMSFVIYLHHTHPDVPWYATVAEWREQNGMLAGTVHVRFPWLTRILMLNIMEHNAHHFAPGVPLYNLPAMQAELAGDETVVEWTWAPATFLAICAKTKLFDYDRRQWLRFSETAGSR